MWRLPPDDKYLKRHRYLARPWHLAVNVIAASPLCTHRGRTWIYRRAGIEVTGHRVTPRVFFECARVTIGHGTYINAGTGFYGHGRVTLGEHCAVGNEAHFATHHHVPLPLSRAGKLVVHNITVGDGVWIGSRAMLLPGVTVGDRCIIAAGAVVTSDCAADGLYAGVPATRRRDLTPLPDGQTVNVRT